MNLKLLGLLVTSMGAIAALTAGVGFITLRRWLAPIEPVIYLAAVLAVLFVVLAAAWVVVTKRELDAGIGAEGESAEERGLRRLVMIASQVILGALAVGLFGMWNLGQVRATFVPFVADSHVTLENPLRDPSPAVREAACVELFRRGWVFRSRGALISALDPHPDVAWRCLETAARNEWKGADILAADLGEGWQAELIAAEEDAAALACNVVPYLPSIDAISGADTDVRMISCATGSASDTVRKCCAASIGKRGKLPEVFDDARALGAQIDGATFGQLLRYSFRPLSLPDTRQEVVRELHADDEETRRWVAQLGCGMLDPTLNQTDLVNGFFPLVESRTCGLTVEAQLEYANAPAWVRLCEEIVTADPAKPVEQTVCDAIAAARKDKAIEQARLHVWEAIRAPFLERDADFVTSGVVKAEAMGGGGSKTEQFARKKREEWESFLNTSISDYVGDGERQIDRTRCQRTVIEFKPAIARNNVADQMRKEWTHDCDSFFDDRSFGEIYADRHQTIGDLSEGKDVMEAGPDRDNSRQGRNYEKAKQQAREYMKAQRAQGR